ncbi:MAG: DUF5060 domain-containing protein [Bacteroidota bacterium]
MKQLVYIVLSLFCNVALFGQSVEKYGKFETDVASSIEYENPYNYDEVTVAATFTAPDGQQFNVDGFYIENFDLDTSNGGLSPSEVGFKVRFSPNQTGVWNYELAIIDSTGTNTVGTSSFECVESAAENNHGFVRKNDSNYLSFDDGDQYILVGENMAWQTGNTVNNYKSWIGRLSDFGGNFIRLWHAHWGLGIEWKNGWSGFKGLRNYQQIKSRYQDWLYDFCAEKGVYVMLCIQHHGQVSSQVNPNWNDSPYNVANGGPCQNTWDFFTDSLAIAHTKNRLRYIVARWGYSKNIMAWELFNEVEWTDNYSNHKEEIAEWHFEMSSYLKSIDPYGHIVTTSYAHDDEDPLVWSSSDMDITQTHFYNNVPNIERVLAGGVRRYLNDYQKPTLTGEFGLGGSSELANNDPDGIHLHNSLWGALMAGGMGTGMTWWWDSYIHPLDLYFHFDGVEKYSRRVAFLDRKLKPGKSAVSGAIGDLNLTPSSGWGTVASDSIVIDEFGQIIPEDATLGQYLYGSQWNTQYRSPPRFYVNYPDSGYFQVRTSSANGQSPHIAIWVDTVMVFVDSLASTNTIYEIGIPAGEHIIEVDNTGTDWITIAGYTFSDLGSKVDSYLLTAEENNYAAGWVLNNEYNHENVVDFGEPDPVSEASLIIPEFENGNYFVTWLDCLTGEVMYDELIEVGDSSLTVQIPELLWDAAFIIDTEQMVAVTDSEENTFSLYPNPTIPGTTINLAGLQSSQVNGIDLIDISGRHIYSFRNTTTYVDGSILSLRLPTDLNTGMYWIKVQYESGKVAAQPLVIGRE